MSLKGKLRCVGLTDTGRVREHNEDTIAWDADIGLLVLADGMGGYNAGEVASGIAVKTIVNLVREAIEREDLSVSDPAAGMSRVGNHPARCHHSRQQDHLPDRPHPAATARAWAPRWWGRCSSTTASRSPTSATRACTACAAQALSRSRMDHSLLQELVDRGFYSPEEAQRAANKNYVTRALGVEAAVSKWRSRSTRCSVVTYISFAPMVYRTWSRTTIFT